LWKAVGCSPLFFKERGPTVKQAGGESIAKMNGLAGIVNVTSKII
jgi:hypothetical protein